MNRVGEAVFTSRYFAFLLSKNNIKGIKSETSSYVEKNS